MQEIQKPPDRRASRRILNSELEGKKPSVRRTVIISSMVILTAVTVSIVVGLYLSTWKNLWRPVVTVNDETMNMDYLIRRMKYVDKTNDVMTMLYDVLPSEMLIRQGALDYGLEVTPDEIDEFIREIARGENENISESEFKAWYRNKLNETRLTNAEYRNLVRTAMLTDMLNEYLIERMPTIAEQIHLCAIVLPSYEEAEVAISRIGEGEDFSELARDLSIERESGEQGGDTGWWPEGVLQANLGRVAFSLEIGQISNPVLIDEEEQTYAICLVTEISPAREIEKDRLEVLKGNVFQEWLDNEKRNSTISFGGMDWSELAQRYVFGSKTMAWLNMQLSKE